MHYVSAEKIGKSYGIQPLFTDLSFHVEEGDKIAVVARNGAGKSTLLKILAGTEVADSGKVWIHKDVTVVLFEQEPVFNEKESIADNIFFHDHPVMNAIRSYEALSESGDAAAISASLARMDELGAWDFDAKVKQILTRLNIRNLSQTIESLSGGQRKRVALAKTLIDIGFENRHVLLIMDEPTNHLDVEMVEWLEAYLEKEKITLILVSHDRYFVDAVCNEIWEIDNQQLFVYRGDYENYLEKKAAREESDAASIDKAKNTYRKELEWMRKQPRARTTKSKSRQDRFYDIEKKAKQQIGDADLSLQVKMNRLGGKVAEIKKLYKSYGDNHLLKGFDYNFSKGERVGLVGRNGAGKSTFVRLLLGEEQPDSGKINLGDTVVFGHYAQEGLQVKEDLRVIEYVKNIAESFPLAGGGSLSAAQFLQLFLFDPDKQYTYISKLSGGEKRRLQLLSILFRNPNFLILDEPTNDLDLPTLAVLEQFLLNFPGCLLLISHDRYFMDRLVDHLLVFEGQGTIRDFPGNYSQYRATLENEKKQEEESETKKQAADTATSPKSRKRLSFNEKREMQQLEKDMETLAKEKTELTRSMTDGSADYEELQKWGERIAEISSLLDEKELRWLELSEFDPQ